ncbi:MAG: formylglycine-generating enzyme family protein [Planctomycetota bacterium]|nr:formylglycine-generating enzyme family protein [Planctomycetota bacterium]
MIKNLAMAMIVLVGAGWVLAAAAAAPSTRPAKELTLDLGNGVSMKWVQIPAGKFLMGSPETEKDRRVLRVPYNNDEVQLDVTISKPFYMGVTEVTQKQYAAVMGDNPSNFKGDDLPVENVSWNDAVKFCATLSQKEGAGKHYRLPTEAEWEYACRAGTKTRFGFGNNDGDLDDYAWYRSNSGSKTHPVGGKKANAWGLYDMHGNVWEWCADWYGDYPGGDATDPSGPATGTSRVLRGGSWYCFPVYCRAAFRHRYSPDLQFIDLIGFRVALDSR